MSSVLTEWPAIAVRTKYNWDLWLDGNIHKLVSGVDFTCKVDVMRINIYRAARARGEKVRSSYIREDNSIIIQRIEQEIAPVSAKELVDSIKLVEVPLPPIKKEKAAPKRKRS